MERAELARLLGAGAGSETAGNEAVFVADRELSGFMAKFAAAVAGSPITRRHTPRTIGPWRRTSSANAAPSCSATNAPSSSPSERAAVWRVSTMRRSDGIRPLACPVGMGPLSGASDRWSVSSEQ